MPPVTREDIRAELENFARDVLRTELDQLKAELLNEFCDSRRGPEIFPSYVGRDSAKISVGREIQQFPSDPPYLTTPRHAMYTRLKCESERHEEQKPQEVDTFAKRLVRHRCFTHGIILTVMASFLSFVAQTDYMAQQWSYTSPSIFFALDVFFLMVFLFDITVRICAERWDFFFAAEHTANLFDLSLVMLQSCEMFIHVFLASMSRRLTVWLRILRVSRVLRVGRILHRVPQMRMLLVSISASMMSLTWILLFVLLTTGTFAVILTQIVTDHKMELGRQEIERNQPELEEYFGSVGCAAFRLFQVITDGEHWDTFAEPLMKYYSPWSALIFVCYSSFTTIALMNVVTAFFVETAMEEANKDFQQQMSAELWEAVHALETNDQHEITEAEFMSHMDTPAMEAYFKRLDLDADKAKDMHFFNLIDKNQSGTVSSQELMYECLKLMGPAKALDLAALILEVRAENERNEQHREWVTRAMQWLHWRTIPHVRGSLTL